MPEPGQTPGQSPARVVAYQHPDLDGVLLCREHGESRTGLIPLTPTDLPYGGFCTWGTTDTHVCGRALPAKNPQQ